MATIRDLRNVLNNTNHSYDIYVKHSISGLIPIFLHSVNLVNSEVIFSRTTQKTISIGECCFKLDQYNIPNHFKIGVDIYCHGYGAPVKNILVGDRIVIFVCRH